jgi:hypothetical protein
MVKSLPASFEMNPSKVPISKFPITNLTPIYDFNNICYNTAAEFVDGFNQDKVTESKAGHYCKQGIKTLVKAIGKDPDYTGKKFKIPIIRLRRKLFAEGLSKYGNAKEAKEYCIRKSDNKNKYLCSSAYDMYNTLYSKSHIQKDKMNTLIEQSKRHNEITEKFETKKHEKPNCWVVGILSVIFVLAFITLLVLVINNLVTATK